MTPSATPIGDALAAEFPLPERPLSDVAGNERRRIEQERAKSENSRSARRAKAAEAKAAARRERDEAKAEKAAAKAAARPAAARTDEISARSEAESAPDEPTVESSPDKSGEVTAALTGSSRIEQELANAKSRAAAQAELDETGAKARAAAQSEQDDADAKSRAMEEAAQRDRAEADAQAREAKEEARRERDAAKAAAAEAKEEVRRERAEAKEEARRERDAAKADAAEAKEKARSEREVAAPVRERVRAKAHDDIVEAPREPKVPLAQRLRQSVGTKTADPDAPAAKSGNAVAVLAVVLGTLGFVCSVILAIGAFLVALSPHNHSGAFDKVSSLCDTLVGPLRDVFSFSGVNGDSKDALVAWGLGALGYLIIGLFAQTFLRSHAED